jgi:hypothetical protein
VIYSAKSLKRRRAMEHEMKTIKDLEKEQKRIEKLIKAREESRKKRLEDKRKKNPPFTQEDYVNLIERLVEDSKGAARFWAKRGLTIKEAHDLAEAEKRKKKPPKLHSIALRPTLYQELQGLASDQGKSVVKLTDEIMTKYLNFRPAWANNFDFSERA